ncbi:MAG TPA: Xaa-Pro peptidase family protein [Candidatus Nitrosotalea sp.]|nr:Xaa-Pro peptidase family protein [Candidatus Nitrosotalea sp.]
MSVIEIPTHTSSTDFEWPMLEDLPFRAMGASNMSWGGYNIDVGRMIRYRVGRVKEQLDRRGIGAILSLSEWNNQYVTGVVAPYWTTPSSGLRYALYCGTLDNAILYEQGEIGYHARSSCPWLHKVKVAITGAGWIGRTMGPHHAGEQTAKMVRQISQDMRDAGLDPAQAGLAIDTWDPDLFAAFEKAGVKLSMDGVQLMLEARKIKSRDEVECIRVACAIGESEFEALRSGLRPGVRESELVGAMHKRCYENGGRIYSGVFVASGPGAWPNPRDETDRMIQPSDIVYSDVYNTSYMGYKICYYRTFSCGKASEAAKDDYLRAREWLYNAIDLIKPGVTTRELAEQWPVAAEVWKDIHIFYEDQTAGSNWGHGCGLTLYEPPIVWREASLNDPVPLEEGMTFAMETQHGRPGKHGVRIEEMVHVTKNGVEVMSKWPVDTILEVPI